MYVFAVFALVFATTASAQVSFTIEKYLNWRFGQAGGNGGVLGIDSVLLVGSTDDGTTFDFEVGEDGDLDKIKGLAYSWPAAHANGYLLNNGSGTLSFATGIPGGNLSGFTQWHIPYGHSDGSLTSSAFLQYSESIYGGFGAGLSIHNTNAPATLPSFAMIELKSDQAGAELQLQSALSSGIRYINSAGNSQWFIYMNDSDETLRINNIAEDDALYINGASMRFTENTASEYAYYWNDGGYKITNNDNPVVFSLDQNGTVYTFTNDGSTLEVAAPVVVDNTTTGTDAGLTVKLSDASASGNILNLSNSSGAATTFNVLGKFGMYGGSSLSAGDVFVSDGTNMELLAMGSPGEVLQVNSGGTALTYDTPLQTQVIGGNQDANVPASTTGYLGFYSTSTAVEARRVMAMPIAGTISKLYVVTSGAQDARGSLVITLRNNGVSQSLTTTVPAGSGAGTFSDTSNSFTVSAGDLVSIQVTNNATTTSARIVAAVVVFEHH